MTNTCWYQPRIMMALVALCVAASLQPGVMATEPTTPPATTTVPGTEPPVPPVVLPPPAQTGSQPPSFPLKDTPPLFSETESNTPPAEPPGIGGMLGRTVLVLGCVIGALVCLAWGLQRYGVNRAGQPGAQDLLTVMKIVPLGERRFLSVVRFGDQILLLGSTAQTITVLASQPEPSSISDPESTFSGCSVAEMLDSVNYEEP